MRVKFEIGFGSECPHCKVGTIDVKRSKYGNFYGCSQFPRCAFTQRIEEPPDIEYYEEQEEEDSGLVFNSKYK